MSNTPAQKQFGVLLADVNDNFVEAPITANVGFRFEVPSSRLHWSIDVGISGNAQFDIDPTTGFAATAKWTLTPYSKITEANVPGPRFPIPLQPVVINAPLPDAYEGESLTQLWVVTAHLAMGVQPAGGPADAQIWGVLTVGVANNCNMSAEEWAYWLGRVTCTPSQRDVAQLRSGP